MRKWPVRQHASSNSSRHRWLCCRFPGSRRLPPIPQARPAMRTVVGSTFSPNNLPSANNGLDSSLTSILTRQRLLNSSSVWVELRDLTYPAFPRLNLGVISTAEAACPAKSLCAFPESLHPIGSTSCLSCLMGQQHSNAYQARLKRHLLQGTQLLVCEVPSRSMQEFHYFHSTPLIL